MHDQEALDSSSSSQNSLKRSLLAGSGVSQPGSSGDALNGASAANGAVAQLSQTDREIVRLIGQHLRDLGFSETVEALMRESRCQLEHPAAAKFRLHVLNGKWDLISQDLKALRSHLRNPEKLPEMQFLVLEQQYLELLETGEIVEALRLLREQLNPISHNTARLHELSSFLMYKSVSELRTAASWAGCSPDSRRILMDRLQDYLPPSVMLPPRRLRTLLEQASLLQQQRCRLHNRSGSLDPDALLADHKCNAQELFPTQVCQVLTEHSDEVMCCRFNHAGTLLATGSKEPVVVLWTVDHVRVFDANR